MNYVMIFALHVLLAQHLATAFTLPTLPSRNAKRATIATSRATTAATDVDTPRSFKDAERRKWLWKGSAIEVLTLGVDGGQPVFFVHGFGCSITYWRRSIDALASTGKYTIFAFDLLGQGRSDKPNGVYYSINLWAELLDDLARDVLEANESAVLIGNSLGSLVALAAAAGDHAPSGGGFLCSPGRVKGLGMFNCGVGLNVRGIADEPQWTEFQKALLKFVTFVFDAVLFNNPVVLNAVLTYVVTKDLLRNALKNLYLHNPSAVDDELVDSFYEPAKSPGAQGALRQIYTNEPGLSPMALHKNYPVLNTIPIHLVWGENDLVTPIEGGVGKFYTALGADAGSKVSIDMVDSGHIPMDDNAVVSNKALLRWLEVL